MDHGPWTMAQQQYKVQWQAALGPSRQQRSNPLNLLCLLCIRNCLSTTAGSATKVATMNNISKKEKDGMPKTRAKSECQQGEGPFQLTNVTRKKNKLIQDCEIHSQHFHPTGTMGEQINQGTNQRTSTNPCRQPPRIGSPTKQIYKWGRWRSISASTPPRWLGIWRQPMRTHCCMTQVKNHDGQLGRILVRQ